MKGISYVKSHYSILESSVDIKNLLAKANDFNYEYITISDSNNLHGALDFVFSANKSNVKPIVGMEITVFDKIFQGQIHLFPNSNEGFYQLVNISTLINVEKKQVSWKDLFNLGEELSVVIPSQNGPISAKELIKNEANSEKFIRDIKKHFKNIYFGINFDFDLKHNQIPITPIIFNKTLFIDKENYIVPDILKAINKLQTVDINSKNHLNNYLFSQSEIGQHYDKWLIDNTNDFYTNQYFKHEFKKTTQPEFTTKNKKEFLKTLCYNGLSQKTNLAKLDSKYEERLFYELDIINKLNFENYFIIVWDFVKYAKDNNIAVGPGRGSAAGSLVAYALNITDVDPLKYNLLFERFLNIDRVSMPDIDLDFEDERREEVINYVAKKYGYEHVAYISTFQKIGSKMAIRDVGRTLNIPLAQINLLTKKVPNKAKITLQESLDLSIAFRKEVNKNLQNQKIIKIAKLIEGNPRQLGTHAAGILISTKPLKEILPLTISKTSDILQTQYSMHNLEKIGLLKMDFLGIRNLTTIQSVVGMVKNNLNIQLDMTQIPLNDIKTFKMLSKGITEGIFQLESTGMKDVLKGVKPRSIQELAIAISLFRPGPKNNIPSFIKRKYGNEKITYLHQDLEPILKNTQGIIVYQEQIMQIANKIAGFSFSKADILRRAMSKKNIKEMMSLEKDFITGATNNKYDSIIAKQIYDLIYEFANYGFNSAHSVSYSMIGYQLAYLKAHYPKQFLVSLLTTNIGNDEKLQKYLHEANKIGIDINVPSINISHKYFVHHNNKIYFPLISIKSLGSMTVNKIIELREKHNKFDSFEDFVIKTFNNKVSQSNIEAMIKAGTFDEFGHSRISMLNVLSDLIKYANLLPQDGNGKLFNLDIVPMPQIGNKGDDENQKLKDEFETLGFYVSSHPVKLIKDKLKENLKNFNITDIAQISSQSFNKTIAIFAMVKSLRTIKTKNNKPMMFLTIEDDSSQVEAVVFTRVFDKVGHKLTNLKNFGFKGKFDRENNTFIIEDVKLQEKILG